MSNLLSGYGDPNSIFSLFEKRKKKVQNLEKLSGGRALCLTTLLIYVSGSLDNPTSLCAQDHYPSIGPI